MRDAAVATESYEWSHTLGDVVTALATAGLRIAFVHEFPFCDWEYLQGMQRGTDGYYRLANDAICIPQIYSIKATR
ncbi:MAG: hypothetical protein ABI867_20580 [Kofleriaceae bacterium]